MVPSAAAGAYRDWASGRASRPPVGAHHRTGRALRAALTPSNNKRSHPRGHTRQVRFVARAGRLVPGTWAAPVPDDLRWGALWGTGHRRTGERLTNDEMETRRSAPVPT